MLNVAMVVKQIKQVKHIILFLCIGCIISLFSPKAVYGQSIFTELEGEGIAFFRNYPEYLLGSVNAHTSITPSFFKKSLHSEWRALTKYPLDTVSKSKFEDFVRVYFSPFSPVTSTFSYGVLVHAMKERIILPQITVGYGHMFYVPIYESLFLPTLEAQFSGIDSELLDYNLSAHAITPSITFSKSISHHLKFFVGYRPTFLIVSLNLLNRNRANELLNDIIADNPDYDQTAEELISEFDDRFKFLKQVHYFVIGFSHIPLRNNWENSLTVGVDPIAENFYYNIEFSRLYVAVGISFTPSSVLVLRPYLRIRFLIL